MRNSIVNGYPYGNGDCLINFIYSICIRYEGGGDDAAVANAEDTLGSTISTPTPSRKLMLISFTQRSLVVPFSKVVSNVVPGVPMLAEIFVAGLEL